MYTGAGLLAFGTSYYVYHLDTVPISNRRRFLDITPKQEQAIAQLSYNEIMTEYGKRILPASHPYTQFVRRVAKRIIQVSGMRDLKWEVHVIDHQEPNAFVLPGGKVFVFTGILPLVQDEDGMAAILGHEVAHQVARHTAEKLSFTKFQIALSMLFDSSWIFSRLFANYGLHLPFSRKCEQEADYIGLLLMAQACYDPRAAVGIWERFDQMDSKQVAAFMSTHPSHQQRVAKIQSWLPEAELKREASDCQRAFYPFQEAVRRHQVSW